jgi:hypothetical protein
MIAIVSKRQPNKNQFNFDKLCKSHRHLLFSEFFELFSNKLSTAINAPFLLSFIRDYHTES